MGAIVCNASPLIILAKAGYLDMIRRAYSPVYVPSAVHEEITAGHPDDPICKELSEIDWFEFTTLETELSPLAHWRLGRGETEVIEFARLTPGTIALLDDKAARRTAMVLNIPILGTLGLIAMTLRNEPMVAFARAAERLREVGLYIDDELMAKVTAMWH